MYKIFSNNLYLSSINRKTLIALIIAAAAVFLAYRFNMSFDVDLTLLSIAIIFPLVFTIRSSFRRREKALEHLSQFRSAIKTLYYFVSSSSLSAEEKKEIEGVLEEVSEKTITHLKNHKNSIRDLDDQLNKVYHFISSNEAVLGKGLKVKIFRYLNDLHESVDNLNAILVHRTPISLKAYCKIFIYVFPVIYTPTIIHSLGIDTNHMIAYVLVLLTEFVLISLYNIQDDLEYPFDAKGLDDIKLDQFKMKR